MRYRASALVALSGLVAYALLCPPVSGTGDSSEFALVLATGGVAHPTGYPLYTLFGHPFCVLLHALGVSWPLAASLWSAVGGAIALFFLHALGAELAAAVPGRAGVARVIATLVPVALFAFQPIVLDEATRAEINIWSLAWACWAAYLFVRIAGRLAAGGGAGLRRDAALWGLACGVGLAHHITSVLISAALSAGLIAMLGKSRRLSPALVATALGACLVPLASYGIIAWRAGHPVGVQWPFLEPGLAGFLEHISGAQYRHFVGRFAPSKFEAEVLVSTAYPFLFPGMALLVLGLARARNFPERIGWASLFAACLLASIFVFAYGVHDPSPYLLPPMALGVAAVAPTLLAIRGAGSRAGAWAIAAAALLALWPVTYWLRENAEKREATTDFENLLRSMWSYVPSDTAIVSWSDDRFHKLMEYQVFRKEKPAVLVVAPDLLFSTGIRHTIRERFGADPVEGFGPSKIWRGTSDETFLIIEARNRLMRYLNDRVRVPVILFDPTRPIVWQLRKSWEPPDSSGAVPPPPTSGGR